MRAIRLLVSAVLATALLVAPGVSVGPGTAASSGVTTATLKASRTSAVEGERVKLSGRVPAAGSRPVVLQRRQGSKWATVAKRKTKATGRFTFKTVTRPTTTSYRVHARASGGAKTVNTPRVKVGTLPQLADLTLPSAAKVGQSRAVTATFTPARPARPVELQVQQGGAWQMVDAAAESSNGTVSFTIQPDQAGTFMYRAVAAVFKGAKQATTPTRSISVTGTVTGGAPVGPVTDVTVTATTTTTISLSWTNPGDADLTGVMIRRQTGTTPPGSPTAGTLVGDPATPAASFTSTALAPGVTYAYALFAHDAGPTYAAGATVTGTTAIPPDVTPPGPVSALTVTGTTASSVSLSWTNPAAVDLTGVMIRRAVGAVAPASASSGTLVVDQAPPSTTLTDTAVVPSTQYSYALFAHDGVPNYASGASATASTGVATTADWAQSRHDAEHRGWSAGEQTITSGNVPALGQEWKTLSGSPAVVGSTLYVIGPDELGNGGQLAAYDLVSGDRLWRIETGLCKAGPISVTGALVVVGCGAQPRAYDRGGSHAVMWDTQDTDPSTSVQNGMVLGSTLVAWSATAVTAYQLSDGQKMWSQLASGATFILDVAGSGNSVVVAYSDRLRALSLTNGSQLWSRSGVVSGQVVIADGWVYTNQGNGVVRYALGNGADGWTAPAVHDIVKVAAVDADTVYAWEAVFDFGPPAPSVLHALSTADGSERWQVDIPSRLRSLAVTGGLVWATSSDIFSQDRSSDLIALDRGTGTVARTIHFGDNMYGDVAFAGGKAIVDQGGSFGGPDLERVRVFGLAGARPDITTTVLPVARTGTPYAAQLESVDAPGPVTWSLVSGSWPAGLSLGAGGLVSGTPTAPATARVTVRATGANARQGTRSLALMVLGSTVPTWVTSGRTAARNPFEPGVPELDLAAAPTFGPRWKTVTPGASVTFWPQDLAYHAARLYGIAWDGQLRAFDTAGNAANRTPLWAVGADGTVGTTALSGSPTLATDRLVVFDNENRLYGIRASDGAWLWHTDPVAYGPYEAPLVVGTTVVVRTSASGLKAFSTVDGSALWGGGETTVPNGVDSLLSSDGTRVFFVSECELYAVNVANGVVAWHTPVRGDPAVVVSQGCGTDFNFTQAPIVVGANVYAVDVLGAVVVNGASGTPSLRFAYYGFNGTDSVVVGDLWVLQDDDHIVAIDTVSGSLAWKSTDTWGPLLRMASTGDLVILTGPHGIAGISRVTGETVWNEQVDTQIASSPAIGPNRIFAAREDGVHAFGPL